MELEFGTAGIRGIVGSKKNNLNEAHVARVFEAFAKYLLTKYKTNKKKCVVIGRDNRKKGKNFSYLAVNILTSHGIEVYFDDRMIPTPFISFLTRYKNAIGAINITASHNPKEYNGIKLYDNTGCQLLPKEIEEIKSIFLPYEKYVDLLGKEIELSKSNLINKIEQKDYDQYINDVLKLNTFKDNLSNVNVTYSSLHGTGYEFVKKIFKKTNVNAFYEPKEIIEDENFTYAQNPNPESKDSFKNSIELAKKENSDIVLLTDPDSDRMGIAVRTKDNEFIILNGNEVAILIMDFLLENKSINKKDKNYMIYSFVSSSLPAKMCKENGINFYMVETGFKWIGKLINDLQDKEKFLFAFEESYGSLLNENIARDKDAIQCVLMILVVTSFAKSKNMTLLDVLENIYKKYGFLKSSTLSFDLKDEEEMIKIKAKFMQIKFPNSKLIDYSQGIRNIEKNNMVAYEFNNFTWVALRPSGTEPKFKVYIHVIGETREKSNSIFDEILNEIKKIIN